MKFPTARARRLMFLLPVLCLSGLSAGIGRADSTRWRDADYARFTPQTFSVSAPAQRVIDPGAMDHDLLSAAIFFATNAERIKNGRTPFVHSRALQDAAFGHSRDMALGGFFSHENPKSAAKRSAWQRMAAEGVAGGHRAENIAMRHLQGLTYQGCAAAVVTQWMNSKGHRANILNRKLRFLGCGAHPDRGPRFRLLATQNFSDAAPR